MLIFGLGETSKIVVIGISTFHLILINTLAEVMGIDQTYYDSHPDARVDKIALQQNQDRYLERGYHTQGIDLSKVIGDAYTDDASRVLGPCKE